MYLKSNLNKPFFIMGSTLAISITSLYAHGKPYSAQERPESDIEVIEVHAQKRSQKITDVSVAVTALDGETISALQLKDTTQLAPLVPNLKITNNAGEGTPPAFNIRGVGMIDYNTSTISPIAIYNDGVVSGSANNLSVNLFDIESVEVLRGPQGTLFGRNTTGGAILVRSNLPQKELGGYLSASIAEHQHTTLNGAVNFPLTETTAARFAFNQQDYHFSTNNLMPGQPDGGLKQTQMRLIIQSEFERVSTTFKFHQGEWHGKPKPIASNGIIRIDGSGQCTPNQAGSSLCRDAFGGQINGNDFWDVKADTADREHDSDVWGASFNLQWQLSDTWSVNAISAIRDLSRFHTWDSDGAGNLIEGTMGTENRLVSQEINLARDTENYYWQTGIFYLKETIEQDNSFDLFRDFRAIPDLAANAAQYFYDNKLENKSLALYSQVDFALLPSWTLTAGLRFTDEETIYNANADLDTEAIYINDLWDLTGKISDQEFSGKVALNKRLSQYNNLYVSYTRGYKSGGYNAGYSTSPQQAMDSEYAPETLDAYEVGAKLHFDDNNLRWFITAFYYDYKDQQVFVNIPNNVVPYHVLKNAGDSKIYGLENEFTYTPTNNLQFVFNIGYLPKAETGRYKNGPLVVQNSQLPFSSKWNISALAIYESQLFGKALTSQLSFDYQSDFFFDQNENPYTQQPDYTLVNGRITYQILPQLNFTVWGKNLFETEYAELRFDSIAALGAVTELKGERRQLGIEVKYMFN